VNVSPKSFCTANEETFSANRKGELVVDVPVGVDSSRLCQTEVLYSPEVGYTLFPITGQWDLHRSRAGWC